MFAAIDLGSNSFRMHIGNHDGETLRVVRSGRDQIRLAAGLDAKGNLSEAAMQRALASLARFRLVLAEYKLEAVRVVATNTMRVAKNAAQFLPLAEQALGYPIEIISGEEEGRLIYMGVSNALGDPLERRLVIDIGGGSTELILGSGTEIEEVESFSVGTVRHGQNFFIDGAIDAPSFEAAILSAHSYFEDAALPFHPQYWQVAYGSSGTIRAIADIIARNNLGDGSLSQASLHALKQRFIGFGAVSRINLAGVKPDRAATIVGGLAILIGLAEVLAVARVHPVEAGLRMGVMWDLYLRATKRDRRELSARSFLRKFHADEARADRVAQDALILLSALKPAGEAHQRLLYWSALLHETGMVISHTGYHKHAAYMIENGDLPGFTARELRTMSKFVLSQKGNLRKLGEALADPDFAKAVLALRLAVVFMHARAEVDIRQMRLRMKNKIELDLSKEWLTRYPTVSYWLGKEKEWWAEVGMPFIIKENG